VNADTALLRRVAGLPPERYCPPDQKVDQERVASLADLIGEPTRYMQRVAEQLSFIETGGQRWTRTLQIQLPDSPNPEPTWWIVPLGQLKRRRLADFVVSDATKTRLNLLTREQHGNALTDVVTTNYSSTLFDEPEEALATPELQKLAEVLRSRMYRYFSALGAFPDKLSSKHIKPVTRIEEAYEHLLTALGISGLEHERLSRFFSNEFSDASRTTQYLCWVTGAPKEVINLQVIYSVSDPKHQKRTSWYRQYGLAPIDYAFKIPTEHRGPTSYYFTLEPPERTICTYLDWEIDNSFNEGREVDAGFHAAYIHNEYEPEVSTELEPSETTPSGRIRAYLRCRPQYHKQILGATLLNIAIVWLLARGRLSFEGSLQGLIVAAPSVLLAFLVQQQRHYYAHVLRRQRAILWAYLAVSVAFVVLVPVGELDEHTGRGLLHSLAVISAWTLGIVSAGVFVWHAPLGGSYEGIVKRLTKRKLKRKPDKEKWECFAAAVRLYCHFCFGLAVVAMMASFVLLDRYADFSSPSREKDAKAQVTISVSQNRVVETSKR